MPQNSEILQVPSSKKETRPLAFSRRRSRWTSCPKQAVRRPKNGLFPLLRYSPWDALLIGLALLQGIVFLLFLVWPVIAIGIWWNSNTIAHNAIHKPFFRSRRLNSIFALYQSVLLGIPQSIWRGRHLAHHAGVQWRPRLTWQLVGETSLVLLLWTVLLIVQTTLFLQDYLPGYGLGLALCWLHGYYEHARGTKSHYGRLYNLLFFNDGYHVEHHARPATHWRELKKQSASVEASRWPAILRWLEVFSLDSLEGLVVRFPGLQRFVLARHEAAFRRLLPALPASPQVAIVGGGLFPRTLLVLRRLIPDGRFVLIDRSAVNLATARSFIEPDGRVQVINKSYQPQPTDCYDLLVFPLAYVGNREALYQQPGARCVIIHDWIWRRRGTTITVSWLLLKRLNMVRP
ncbi:MAG TPA: fatty acid desaturase [Gemmataceae bacterium]|nr:fatty acid desaturase [Gemmataceae bacterium]